ncbi:hypothetical protein L1049_004177 [Liquidambar formosana]|uniref:Ubiquitin-like-conjugating enzyme ATG10 n=1 Tax=Liquidambar formosana TaxID=63359 RepID=A0AAP0RNV7_LIQFO
MKVAELLFKNGFKEAYAIKGGIGGKDGWRAIQENLLPPSVHIYPKKKAKMSQQFEMNGGVNQQSENNYEDGSHSMDNGYVKSSMESSPKKKLDSRSSSPYPNVVMVSNQTPMDISSWDGTLSSSDFCLAACAFVEKWKSVNPGLPPWSWVPCPKSPWFASHEEDAVEVSHSGKEELGCSEEEEPIDNALSVQSYSHEVHCYDFHIVYSTSYRVPVLYFRAYCSDGQPLVLDDIEKDFPVNSAKLLLESKWTFITQEEHPYLNRPWYKLHPCGTNEWMKLLFLGDPSLSRIGVAIEHYLVSWLSVVGQVVGLKIPLEMLNNSSHL